MRTLLFCGLLIGSCVADGGNLLKNGSFELGSPGGVPENWHFAASGAAQAEIAVTDESATDGKQALRFASTSARQPNVYGMVVQEAPLRAGVPYVLKFKAKGENANGFLVCIGKGWHLRFRPQGIGPEWRSCSYRFTLKPEQLEKNGKAPVVLIVEDTAGKILIDEISITEEGNAVVSPAEFQRERVCVVPEFSGELSKLRTIPAGVPVMKIPSSPEFSGTGAVPDPKRFSAEAALMHNERGLIFLVEVKDSSPNPGEGELMWKNDSVQIRLDQAGLANDRANESDLEFGVSVGKTGTIRTWNYSGGGELPADSSQWFGHRGRDGYFIAGVIGWNCLAALKPPYFTFNVVVNDLNANKRRDVYFLTPGLHDAKYSTQYVKALLDTGRPVLGASPANLLSTDAFTGTLVGANLKAPLRLEAAVTDGAGRVHLVPLREIPKTGAGDMIKLEYAIPAGNLADGECRIEFRANGEPLAGYAVKKADLIKQQSARLDAALRRLETLRRELANEKSEYVRLPLNVLGDFLPRFRERMDRAGDKRLHAERLLMVMPDAEAALDDLERLAGELKRGRKLPVTWRYIPGPIRLAEGWPKAKLQSSDGRVEERDVVFVGYGHFANMRQDFPNFPKYGANVIQIERGPRSLYPRRGEKLEFDPDFTDLEREFGPMLAESWANGMPVVLLISPHYSPEWWEKAHPEAKLASGFLKYNIAHPEACRMMKAYIRDFLGRLRQQPYAAAIHSICILNEPTFTGTLQEPFLRGEFRKYLEKKFGSVAAFNRAAGGEFPSFDAVVEAGVKNPAVDAEFALYRRSEMKNWAKFLADEVRAVWPGMPVHAKIMIMNSTFDKSHAIDPEMFAEFSDYNGNDNYGNYKEGGYLSDWVQFALGHELQFSMKPASIVNAENHIIRDSERRPIPNDHIYTANFQQHVTGASALVTWVWVDYSPESARNTHKDLQGNIALRPGNVIAQGIAALDAVRLAGELKAFTAYEPEIAILYSPTSTAFNPALLKNELFKFYAQSAFTGHRLRFLSEKQLVEGKLGKTRLLFVIGSANVSRVAADALAKFPGKVVADRHSLRFDEFNRPLKLAFRPEILPDFIKAPELKKRYFDPVVPLPVELEGDCDGIFFRVVPDGRGGRLVNLVNYTEAPRKLRLKSELAFFDLIREETFGKEFELAPLKPLLLHAK